MKRFIISRRRNKTKGDGTDEATTLVTCTGAVGLFKSKILREEEKENAITI